MRTGIFIILAPLTLLAAVLAPAAAGQTVEEDFLSLDKAYRLAAERIAPAVVNIEVDRVRDIGMASPTPGTRPPRRRGFSLPPELLDKFFENRRLQKRPKGGTSGVIISKDGFILTNEYNILGQIKR